MSRGSDTGMKIEHRQLDGDGHKAIGKMVEEKPQLYRRITGSDPAIVLLFLFGLVLLIGLSVSLCYPAQHAPSLAKSQVRLRDSVYQLQLVYSLSVLQMLFSILIFIL